MDNETVGDGACDHCGRQDLGSPAAGRKAVRYKGKVYQVCNPTIKYRPRCYTLMTTYAHNHTPGCWPCAREYPPGAELRAIPEEGRWSHRDAWMAAA